MIRCCELIKQKNAGEKKEEKKQVVLVASRLERVGYSIPQRCLVLGLVERTSV